MIRALHNGISTASDAGFCKYFFLYRTTWAYSGVSHNTKGKQQKNLNYLLESAKKHPYGLLSKSLGSIYTCHKSESGRMYTKNDKNPWWNHRLLFKSSGVSLFRIQDPGHRIWMKAAEEIRKEEKLCAPDNKRLGKGK